MTEMTVDVSKVAIPVWVKVIWSESAKFKENELIPFKDFENKAWHIANKQGIGNGYKKTKVEVLFTDGNTYECRLDLARDDEHGFKHHAQRLVHHYENQADDSAEQDYYVTYYKENYEFFKTVVWPE